MIRRLTAPQIPPSLHEAGWRLRHGPYGWHCSTHDQATLVYAAPGAAIAAAWNAAEPDHERPSKLDRQFYQIVMKEREMSDEWHAHGKELHFSADSQDFVGLHTEALPPLIAERHNATAHKAAQWQHANVIAAKAFTQQEAKAGGLEAELARARSDLAAAIESRDQALRSAEAANAAAQLRARELAILQDACRPAATILFNLTQLPGIDPQIRETIQQTLAPLDAALATTKASE